ncbi:flagellin FliC, partial [Enterobacter hormaechei]
TGVADVRFKDGNYYVNVTGTDKDGFYQATVNAGTGAVTISTTKEPTIKLEDTSSVTKVQTVDVAATKPDTTDAAKALADAGVTGAVAGNT